MIPLGEFRVLLLDMNSTFMFGEDRFGPAEDFGGTYHALGGRALPGAAVDRAIRAAYAHLAARYEDPACEDDFPSFAEALAAAAPELPDGERARVGAVFAEHECGAVPPAYSAALRALAATHELRLLTNVWAPKARWIAELGGAGVLPLFRRAVFSSDTRSVKPSARLTRAALEGIACAPSEVLLLGDSLARDMVAGRRAGLATAWVAPATAVPPEGAGLVDYHVPSLLALAGRASARPRSNEALKLSGTRGRPCAPADTISGHRQPTPKARSLTWALAVTNPRETCRDVTRDRELIELQAEALYTHDAAGRLLRVREHNGAPAPRFFLGRTAAGVLCRCRHDVDDALCRALGQAAAAAPVTLAAEVASDGRAADPARYVELLARAAPVDTVWGGPAFHFPAELPDAPPGSRDGAANGNVALVTEANADVLRSLLPDWVSDVRHSPPLLALVVDGRAVAVCGSVRITPRVHEAGVDTAAPFRGRGYAPRVVAAWARAVRALGAEPLYSTDWQNAASRAVARKLGLVLYGTDLDIS